MKRVRRSRFLAAVIVGSLLVGCGGGNDAPAGNPPVQPQTFIWLIEDDGKPSDDAEQDAALAAMFGANAGDTIQFGEGTFDFTKTLVMSQRAGITVKGKGMSKTVLNFGDSQSPEGLSMSHMDGITFEDFTVVDTPGFSVKVSDSDHVVMRRVRTMWTSKDGGMDPNVPSTLDVTCQASAASESESVGTFTNALGVQQNYVTDGPELYRTKDGALLMLWSSWSVRGYVQTIARSTTGELAGPWEQLDPLVWQDSGHGMLFRTFEGELMLVLHRPFRGPVRAKLYEMEDAGDTFRVVRQRTDLDGDE